MQAGADDNQHVQYLMAVPDNVKPPWEPLLGYFHSIHDRADDVNKPHAQLARRGPISYRLRVQESRLVKTRHNAREGHSRENARP